MSAQPLLGILTLYLNDGRALEERLIYERMTSAGKRRGLRVIVFTPDDVQETNGRVHAMVFQPDKQTWSRRWVNLPQLIYDRCRFQRSERFQRLLAFRRKYPHLTYLNRPLRNKWTVYRTLGKEPAFGPHLPATRLYQSPDDVTAMLRRYPTVYFKPINGTGGRGILRIKRLRNGLLQLQGRNHGRQIVPLRTLRREQLAAAIRSWDMRGDRYIVQQGLDVTLPNGRVHDYRMLVQKDGSGDWQVTGCAGRVGPANSITSNLHGGGKAAPMHKLLRQWAGSDIQIAQIRERAEWVGLQTAKHLEKQFGALCELALDLAIDRQGRVWLLEVNPKPSREVFTQAGEQDVYRRALTRPLEYALWVHRRNKESRSRHRSSMSAHRTSELPAERSEAAEAVTEKHPDPFG
jgi:glutathione synthase/RimK-type ligase-like ATP-grasp enzyme